jgi:hypothetical protein
MRGSTRDSRHRFPAAESRHRRRWEAQKPQEAGTQQAANRQRHKASSLPKWVRQGEPHPLPSICHPFSGRIGLGAVQLGGYYGPSLYLLLQAIGAPRLRYLPPVGYFGQLPSSARGWCHVWRLPSQSPTVVLELFEPSIPASQTQLQQTSIYRGDSDSGCL